MGGGGRGARGGARRTRRVRRGGVRRNGGRHGLRRGPRGRRAALRGGRGRRPAPHRAPASSPPAPPRAPPLPLHTDTSLRARHVCAGTSQPGGARGRLESWGGESGLLSGISSWGPRVGGAAPPPRSSRYFYHGSGPASGGVRPAAQEALELAALLLGGALRAAPEALAARRGRALGSPGPVFRAASLSRRASPKR